MTNFAIIENIVRNANFMLMWFIIILSGGIDVLFTFHL